VEVFFICEYDDYFYTTTPNAGRLDASKIPYATCQRCGTFQINKFFIEFYLVTVSSQCFLISGSCLDCNSNSSDIIFSLHNDGNYSIANKLDSLGKVKRVLDDYAAVLLHDGSATMLDQATDEELEAVIIDDVIQVTVFECPISVEQICVCNRAYILISKNLQYFHRVPA